MAIYHLHMKIITRAQGSHAVASAAYRRAAKMFDEQEKKTWNYERKENVVHREILIPETAPQWAKALAGKGLLSNAASEQLWNRVEASEKRVDSQLIREMEFSLPVELDREQNIKLAQEFIQDQFVLRGMIADWSMHWDAGNPHVHVLLTMRELIENGFGKKVTAWNHKGLLVEWRTKWAEYANFHLALNQQNTRIDHRSYKAQGIELVPSTHLGKAVTDMSKRGLELDLIKQANVIRKHNLNLIAAKPTVLLDKITKEQDTFTQDTISSELGRYIRDKDKFNLSDQGTLAHSTLSKATFNLPLPHLTSETITEIFNQLEHHNSVFSEREIAKILTAYTDHAEQFTKAMLEIRSSTELLYLGPGEDGRDRFTTQRMVKLENEVQQYADQLREKGHLSISHKAIDSGLRHFEMQTGKQLTNEQRTAIHHITQVNAISCLIGRAGTGKSFSLSAAREIWEKNGLRVLGTALSGIAADGLEKDAGIPSRTIESFQYAIEGEHLQLTSHDVVVMDEAGMTDSVSMHKVLKAVSNAQAKLVLVGDPDQLQPVGPGATFRALLERIGFAEITHIYRQEAEWQRQATRAFAAGKIEDGINLYEKHGCVQFENSIDEAIELIVKDWNKIRDKTKQDINQYLVTAHRNSDVDRLNQVIRQSRLDRGEIEKGHEVKSKNSTLYVSQGDRLLFLKNNQYLGVKNGRFGTVTEMIIGESGEVLNISVLLDGTNKTIQLDPIEYSEFALGYAATVHKTQGMTVSYNFVYAGGLGWNRNLAYVAMTRHRSGCYLYAAKENHQSLNDLIKSFGRFSIKDSVLDYPLTFASRRGIDTSSATSKITHRLRTQLMGHGKKIAERFAQWNDPRTYWGNIEQKAKEVERLEMTRVRREDARSVAAYVDSHRECGIAWKALEEKISTLGIQKLSYEANEFELIRSTLEYQCLQRAGLKRDQLAVPLAKEPERFERAITLYSLQLNKIKQHADAHIKRELVREYRKVEALSQTVKRDRIAFKLMLDIKSYYRFIKEAGLEIREIRQYAKAHLRRRHLIALSEAERFDFRKIETYQKLTQEIGKLFNAVKEHEQNSAQFLHTMQILKPLMLQRNRLAHDILNHAPRYQSGLDFFQIGLATPTFGFDKPTNEAIKAAESRWSKLTEYANKHDRLEQVKIYQVALKNKDQSRFELAKIILNEPKRYHPAILETHANWRQIRRDANYADTKKAFATFTKDEKSLLRIIKQYQKTNRQAGKIWSQILNKEQPLASKRELGFLLISKRDYWANKLKEKHDHIKMLGIIEDRESPALKFLSVNKRMNFSKIEKQAAQHKIKREDINIWQQSYRNSVKYLREIVKSDTMGHEIQFKLLNNYLDWLIDYEDSHKLSNSIQKKSSQYHYSMLSAGLSPPAFSKQIRYQKELNKLFSEIIKTEHYQKKETLDIERLKKISRAKQIEQGTKNIRGTLAESYLRRHRGIKCAIPNSYRYHPGVYHFEAKRKLPALVVIARDKKQQTKAVQVIYLDKKTANKANIPTPKLTFGVLNQGTMGVLVSPGKHSEVIAIAEGAETALSIREAYPQITTYAVLGSSNFSRVPLSPNIKSILFCADNDGFGSASELKLEKAADYFATKKMRVWKTLPDTINKDFNDLLKENGAEALRTYIKDSKLIRSPETDGILKLQAAHFLSEIIGKNVSVKDDFSLNELILTYLDLEITQMDLVTKKNTYISSDRVRYKNYAEKASLNDQKRKAIIFKIIKHARTPKELEKLKNKRIPSILQSSGFEIMRNNMHQGKLSCEDKAILTIHIRNQANSLLHSQREGRDRGGRSR
jgi:ATP-dependent exoDNAse (exonuclease V) alpha subunit